MDLLALEMELGLLWRSGPWGDQRLREACPPASLLDISSQRHTASLLGFSFHQSQELAFST